MLTYPFIPKTTSKVSVGDIWSIKLDDGWYSAGRVLEIISRVMVLGGVLDWTGEVQPTEGSIAGVSEILCLGP
jgi:hypothetical protein